MERNIADGIQLLKSVVKPAAHWRELLHMPTSKATLLKRYDMVGYDDCCSRGTWLKRLALRLSEILGTHSGRYEDDSC
jgi:hypothetical protein